MSINDKILELLIDDEEITWQAILTNLIKTENLDMWDVDILALTDKFIDTIRKLKELDFRISGKIVLAAAILLRMKSVYLVTDGIGNFDRMFDADDDEETEDLEYSDEEKIRLPNKTLDDFGIVPRTPLPRKRKVSVYDLIDALQKAIEFKNKKVTRLIDTQKDNRFKRMIDSKIDITVVINDIYTRILDLSKECDEFNFDNILYMNNNEVQKKDKVLTLLPLLHLETTDKIEILQKESFGNISIKLRTNIINNDTSEMLEIDHE